MRLSAFLCLSNQCLRKITGKSLLVSNQVKNSATFTYVFTLIYFQVDYILGNNPMKMSYMTGFGSKFPMQMHHRGESIPSIRTLPAKVGCNDGYSKYYYSSKPNPNTHVGAIVGGPDSNDEFKDLRSDYSHAEPTTYMNAAFVGSVAALLAQTKQECLLFFQTIKVPNMVSYI